MTKETVKHTPDARFDAVRYLTGNGTKIVQVDSFLEANRPSEGQGFLLSKQFQTVCDFPFLIYARRQI